MSLVACANPALADRSSGEKAGDALAVLIPAGALAFSLHREDRAGTIQAAKSLAVGTLITFALKEATDKERPDGECCDSFPSAHASAAFGGAAFLHRRYGWQRAWPAYLAATYVGYSRVDADKHFAEDVIAGAAVGILSSWFLSTRLEATQFTPIVQQGYYGLQFSKRW